MPRKFPRDTATDTIPRAAGVYEVAFPPTGYRAFAIVYVNGDIGYVQSPIHRVTTAFVSTLIQEREDSDRPALRLEPSA